MVRIVSVLLVLGVSAGSVQSAYAQSTMYFGRDLPQAMAYYKAGVAHLARERWEPAARDFEEAIRQEGLLTDAYFALGQAYMGLRRYTSAVVAYEKCLVAARTLHGLLQRHAFTFPKKAPQLFRLGERFEVPAPILLSLGSAHFRNGNRDQAEHYWRESVKVDPKLGEAWNNLAAIFLTSGRKIEAEDALARAEGAGFRVNPQMKSDIRDMR